MSKKSLSQPVSEPDLQEDSVNQDPGSSSDKNRIRSTIIPFALVIGLTLLSGVVHGIIDGRWSRPDDLIAQGSRLHELPETCGDWSLVETSELDEGAAKMLRCFGSEVRVYQHQTSNETVTVAILFGPRGPIAVHTPEVCYSSVGTEQIGERKVETIRHENTIDRFWSVQFSEKPSPEPSLDVWYGWSDGDDWVASKHPRFWLTDNLYKIQITGPVGNVNSRPCHDFLIAFLPSLKTLME